MEEKIIVKLEAEIGDLKNQLNAAQGELKRFGVGVEQSVGAITLNSLNSQLVQLQKQLSTVDVGSAAFKNIGAEITAVESKVNSALTSINNNANRSKVGFNGLNNSINQLSRELPAFAINANIGFLAISNNLPILFDEINKVRASNKLLAAEGLVTTSVFKSLSAALFSWQTALSVGVTLLTVYGGKIFDLLSNLGKVEQGFNAAKEELKGIDEVFKSQGLGNTIGQVVLLKSSLETAGKSIKGQKGFVEEYNKTIGTVTGSVNTFKEAEAGLVAGTDAYINAMVQRAIAIKFADAAGQVLLDKEQIRAKQALRIKENSNQYLLQAEQDYANNTNPEETKISGLEFYGQKREKYLKQSIEWQIAQQIEADKKEIASVDAKYKTFEQLARDYYKKSGQINPFEPTKPGKTKTERPPNMALAPVLGLKLLGNDAIKLDQNLKGVKTTLEGFSNLKPLKFLEDYQIENLKSVVNLLGNALTSAFDAALISGKNFFTVLGQALLNLFKKLLAAAAAAAILSLLLAPLGFGAGVTGFVPLFKQLGGIDLSGGKKPKDSMVAMPTNTFGQGGYQIDIMGDKMRLLLDNQAIKNSRVV